MNYASMPDEIDWSAFDFDEYYVLERSVLQPQLEALGFQVRRWIDGERDSFGPLSRVAVCEKDASEVRLVYG
jgi:hypothetical protein